VGRGGGRIPGPSRRQKKKLNARPAPAGRPLAALPAANANSRIAGVGYAALARWSTFGRLDCWMNGSAPGPTCARQIAFRCQDSSWMLKQQNKLAAQDAARSVRSPIDPGDGPSRLPWKRLSASMFQDVPWESAAGPRGGR